MWLWIFLRCVNLTDISFVCAMSALNMRAGIPHLFRTYEAPRYQTSNCTIWEAACATSADPISFKRIVIDGSQPYIDGGLGCNNPIEQVLEEARLMFPDQQITCIVSIGAGQVQTIGIPEPTLLQRVFPLEIVNAMQAMARDCERSAQEIERRFQHTSNFYFRFNVDQGLQNVGLAKRERLDEVTAHTEQYMRLVEVDWKLKAAVLALQERQNILFSRQIGNEFASLL
jgi:predicted acylesterase/phospholipase RssA